MIQLRGREFCRHVRYGLSSGGRPKASELPKEGGAHGLRSLEKRKDSL